ncbi:MAG: GNAT family N-acetyltransferase [Nitrosospira sp.]|nr:GNAT family N-acetyltransferase [Nitrosospira sp.]
MSFSLHRVQAMVNIIRADISHLDTVITLFNAYRSFYGKEVADSDARSFLRERIGKDESVIFLAELDSQPAGFTQLYPIFSSVNMSRVWLLNDLYVADFARLHGVATALLQAATGHASQTGASGLVLQTGRDNRNARALYEREGWCRQDNYYWYDLEV